MSVIPPRLKAQQMKKLLLATAILALACDQHQEAETAPVPTELIVDAEVMLSSETVYDSGNSFQTIEAGRVDAEVSTVVDSGESEAGLRVDSGEDPVVVIDSTVPVECPVEVRFCNPMCDHCDDHNCAYTPERSETFMCVSPGPVGLYSMCKFDDECQSGLVCEDYVCKKACRTNADCEGLDLFEGPFDVVIPEGYTNEREIKDVCQPVFQPSGELQEGLRVCNRFCRTILDKICGEKSGQGDTMCEFVAGDESEQPLMTCQYLGSEREPVFTLDGGLLAFEPLQLRVGSPCTGSQDCTDSFCHESVCAASCASSADCDGRPCVFSAAIGLNVCEPACVPDEIPGSNCSLVTGCGCAQNESCRMGPDQASVCAPNGKNGIQAWCNYNSDCAADLSCVGGLCRPLCSSDSDCQGQGSCYEALIGKNRNVSVCPGSCDPVAGTGCGFGALCYPDYAGPAVCSAEAYAIIPNSEGKRCTTDFGCQTGLGCLNETCQRWCRTDEDCPGTLCKMFEPSRFGVTNEDEIGICTP